MTRKALCNIRAVTASEVSCRDVSRENSVPAQPRTFRVEVHHPPTEQFTYDARPSTRKRTANDESGSAPCVRSRICRSDRPISVAASPSAAQMARPKGIASINCVTHPFRSARLCEPLGTQHGSYVFETALSGRFSRGIWQLSADGWNRTHAGNTEDTLQHAHCRVFETALPGRSSRGMCQPTTNWQNGHTRATWKTLCDICAVTILKLPCRDVSRENSVPVQPKTFRMEVRYPSTGQSTYDARSSARIRPKSHLLVGQAG